MEPDLKMGIPFSSLPPELQKKFRSKVLGVKPPVRRPAPAAGKALPGSGGRWCACGSMMIRPDGAYPKDCPGCRKPWKAITKKD